MGMGLEGAGAGGFEPAQGTPRHAVGLSQLFRSPAAVAREGAAQDGAKVLCTVMFTGLMLVLAYWYCYRSFYCRTGVGVGTLIVVLGILVLVLVLVLVL